MEARRPCSKNSPTPWSARSHPAVQTRLLELGAEPVGSRSAVFQTYVVQEVERWRALVQRSGASADQSTYH